MSAAPYPDAKYLDVMPLHSGAAVYRLDISAVSASITLPAGGYLICVEGMASGYVVARFGGAAVVPLDGANATGFHLSPGAIYTLDTPGAVLHAITSTGTGTLLATKLR
jgi:hypothetical protein